VARGKGEEVGSGLDYGARTYLNCRIMYSITREDCEAIKAEIEELNQELTAGDLSTKEKEAVKQSLIAAKEDLKERWRERVDDWRHYLKNYDDGGIELDDDFLKVFKLPSVSQTQKILEQLDASDPSWEENDLDRFYEATERLFPDLRKQTAQRDRPLTDRKKKGKTGCLPQVGCVAALLILAIALLAWSSNQPATVDEHDRAGDQRD